MIAQPFVEETRLSNEDRLSRTWQIVKSHAERRLAELRAQLEGDASWEDTVAMRRQIKELCRLVELEKPLESQYPAMVDQ